MDRFRDLVFFRNYFEEFYDNQQERVKEKIDAVSMMGNWLSCLMDFKRNLRKRLRWKLGKH